MRKNVLDAVGQTYKDYIITKYLPLSELQSSLIELVHQPSGARIIHIANNDPENLFCLSFQTLPYNSNGVAHILEHTVLCGSEKFPVKDPFFAMTRRSLNTYMNALTGQDFTCYPASSQVEKDFYNLLEVYLDSVFHPELKHLSFLQEGHRFELADQALQFQGVVYNEMKGAMSSVDSRLWEALASRLVPDLPYAHNSGGNPKEIPSLSYEQLIEFHREFYHPSRCLFFFYGNLPLTKHLDFIEKELSRAKKMTPLPPLKAQTRFENPIKAVDFYPVAEGEEQKSLISFAWLTVPISRQSEILALEVINTILTDTDASPLTKALLKSGLCADVDSSLDIEMSEIPLVITCKGCEEENADKLQKVLFDTLKKVVFKDEEVEAALHQLEFERTEIGGEGGPFGLTLFMRSCLIKQHGSEPENALLIHSLFDELRGHLKDPKYLPNLLRKYVVDNLHFVRLVLKPDPDLNRKEQEEEQKRLQAIQSKLTKAEEKTIREQSAKLKAYQEAVEHQSLDCLPKVTLKDVPPHIRDYPIIQKNNVFHHSCFTNQILYADLVFDLPEINVEDLPLLSLFAQILPELGCGGRSYEENLAFQQRYIGGFEANLALHVTQENPDVCRPTFTLRGKALYRNTDKLFQLFSDFVMKPNFSEKARIKEWLSQHATEQRERLNRASMSYAIQNSLKGLSIPSFVHEQWNGISYYKAVMEWEKKFDPALLKKMGDQVLGLKNHSWVFSSDRLPEIQLPEMPNKSYLPWTGKYNLPKSEPQARFIAAPVAFTSLGLRTVSYRDNASPMLFIATELMKNVFLHKEIREKGGAYGGGASYTPTTGNFHFYAYRDPNLKSSVDAFYKAVEVIGNKQFTEQELEEAKLGVLQTLDAPVTPGNRAIVAYSWTKAGRTKELREQFRSLVLHATSEDVARAVQEKLAGQEGVLVSFLGKELYAKEEAKLTTPLKVLSV
ncbi:MAG: insulinase family protein [Parachlamydiales bacterium]|nr:insulinase family protein [Parachlamydiales bacterium]